VRDDDDVDEDEYEDVEQVLFQGPMFGREANLKQNPRLVKAALVPVKKMISDGLSRRAHTILLEPAQGRIVIRFVVDGIPYPAGALPGQRGMAMIQMIKVLAGLNPQERAEPQTGGINAEYDDTRYELLTDFVPLKPGVEKLRIRVENPKISYIQPGDVGMPEELQDTIRELAQDCRGLILTCGPPESGATSLSMCALHCVDPYLYSVFNVADVGNRDLVNVTDYEAEEGHDLELSLERMLRREADIVYMGKVTDPAIIQTMFEFSNRLAFVAEIPANTPADAIRQLIEWVGTDLVSQHVRAILTQKLIRTLCDDCKQAFRPNPQLLKRLSLPPEVTVLYRAPSPPDPDDEDAPTIEELCEDCDGMPFHGRTAVYELLEMSEGMKDVVLAGADPAEVRRQMKEDDMRTLQKDAIRVVVEGRTALEEVQRAFSPPRKRRPKGRPRPRG
jgi:type IV pilus assembly protein PilB